jgi:hypothetical protein
VTAAATSRPIVHIGYHKTATTWFQRRFYPALAGRRYVERRTVREALLLPGALQFDPAAARRHLGRDLGSAILCEENLSGGLHHGGLAGCLSKDVAERIRATLPDARIVIFVRDQADAIASAYVQYVKGGGTHGLDRYLFGRGRLGPNAPEHDEAPGFRFEHFAYDRLVAHYDALFGAAHVHVYRYEDFRADPRGFVAVFAEEHGLPANFDAIDFGHANRGLSRGLLAAARIANLFTARAVADKSCLIHLPYWYKTSRTLIRRASASRWFGRPLATRDLLRPELRAWIESHYRESNAALDRRIGPAARPVAISRAAPIARPSPSRWQRFLAS